MMTPDADEHTGEGQQVGMDPQPDTRVDDQAEREIEHGADGACEGHGGW
jgi:hypothetical protein